MMIKRKADKTWFPFWVDKWIFGSMRIEFSLEERAIWIDLLALASKDDGYIRANEEIPYPMKQLAGTLIIPEDKLIASVNKFIKKGKLKKLLNGTLYVDKWDKYQLSESYLRVQRHRKKAEGNGKSLHASKKALLYNTILDKTILDNKKEGSNIHLTREQEILIDEELKTVKSIGEKKRQMIISYLRELSIEFPDIDYVFEMKKKCTWWRDNPLNKKSNIHLQIRNWFIIAQKGFTEARSQLQVGAPRGTHKTKYPSNFLHRVYGVLHKQNKDGNKYADLIFALTDEEAKEAVEKYGDSIADFIKYLEEKK